MDGGTWCVLGCDNLTPLVLHVPVSSALILRLFLLFSVILFIRMSGVERLEVVRGRFLCVRESQVNEFVQI